MPELPEVETIRAALARDIVGKPIARVHVRRADIIRGGAAVAAKFVEILEGASFSALERRAKLLFFGIGGGSKTGEVATSSIGALSLAVHLKMTGRLIYVQDGKLLAGGHSMRTMPTVLPDKYTHVEFVFADGGRLFFHDVRRFGYMEVVPPERRKAIEAAYGVEPLTPGFTFAAFDKALGRRDAPLKAVLLNQALIAGLGNIYVDESCWLAGVRPKRRVSSLKRAERRHLYDAIIGVLTRAVAAGGTSFRDYVQTDGRKGNFYEQLQAYGQQGQQCQRCQRGVIKKVKCAGRGTHYCPVCQK